MQCARFGQGRKSRDWRVIRNETQERGGPAVRRKASHSRSRRLCPHRATIVLGGEPSPNFALAYFASSLPTPFFEFFSTLGGPGFARLSDTLPPCGLYHRNSHTSLLPCLILSTTSHVARPSPRRGLCSWTRRRSLPPSPQAVTPAIKSVWAAVSNGHPPLSHAQLLVTVADFGRRSGSGYKAAKRVAEIAAIRHEDW